MKLTPIPLPYIKEALDLEDLDAVEEYAVWGGVPRYWELREKRNSLEDALWHNAFSVNGALYEEPEKLFQDDVKDIVKTSTIMSYIAAITPANPHPASSFHPMRCTFSDKNKIKIMLLKHYVCAA